MSSLLIKKRFLGGPSVLSNNYGSDRMSSDDYFYCTIPIFLNKACKNTKNLYVFATKKADPFLSKSA